MLSKVNMLRFALSAICLITAQLHGQQPAAPVITQTIRYVKVGPGKGTEYVQLVNDTTKKVAQMRADAGEIISWTLLRSVYPAGQDARADYMTSTLSEGPPLAPIGDSARESYYKKAGVTMTVSEISAKRSSLSTLVAQEMWRVRARVAAPQKGHYLYLNFMKVHDASAYTDFETAVWRPMAEEWVKQGDLSGWIYATKMLPTGSDTAYSAYSSDMFPTWAAVFKARPAQAVFEKAHSGKNFDLVMAAVPKLRDLAKRELWVVVERVTKKP